MEPTPAAEARIDPRVRPLAEAALRLLAEMEPAEVFTWMTPERLGRAAGFSASSVRYRLAQARPQGAGDGADGDGAPRWSFDREQLLAAALELMAERLVEQTELAVDRYIAAFEAVRDGAELDDLHAALGAELDAYAPGGTAADEVAVSERAYLVAVALADESPLVRRRLRALRDEQEAHYMRMWEHMLRGSGHVLRDGITLRQLARQASAVIDGFSHRRRVDPSLDGDPALLLAIVGIFLALSVPRGGRDPVQEYFAALRRPA